jgi:hypothetical protein
MAIDAAPRRRLRRLIPCVLLAASMITLVAPGTANAASPCPPGVLIGSAPVAPNGASPNLFGGIAYLYTYVSSSPAFNTADAHSVINTTDSQITATFTVEISRTFTLNASVGLTASLFKFLTLSVSSSIQQVQTTRTNITVTSPVPAHTRLLAEYGDEAMDVTYDMQRYRWIGGFNACSIDGPPQRVTTNAPTNVEGWRFTSSPA